MSTRPSGKKAKAAAKPKQDAGLAGSSRQLAEGVGDGKGLTEESGTLNAELELRLAQTRSQLAACSEELRRQQQERQEERNQMATLEEQLDRQKIALDSLRQELETLDYSISHDLAAPLRHVIGFSSVLMEDYKQSLDESAQNYLDCVVRAGRKMELLIEALLGLSRIGRQELRPVRVDLSRMAQECAAGLRAAAPERNVVVSIAGDLSARADAALLRTALERLFENAWKFTRNREKATIEFGSMQQEGESVFFLRDNGAGFDMRFAAKLFGPFQRMHRESDFEGTGIGLATVRRIINRHGGKIWADATVDGGATFYFTLPE